MRFVGQLSPILAFALAIALGVWSVNAADDFFSVRTYAPSAIGLSAGIFLLPIRNARKLGIGWIAGCACALMLPLALFFVGANSLE